MPWKPKQHRPGGVERRRETRTKEQVAENSQIWNYRWRQFSKRYLQENPLCVDHLKDGIVYPATEVHHVKKAREYPELRYEETNLMALCHNCHARRTAAGE